MFRRSIFVFRQDLRIHDNRGFSECVRNSDEVLPVFILDDTLIDGFGGLSDQKFGFLREALEHLSERIRNAAWQDLTVIRGNPVETIPRLVREHGIDAVYANRSYASHGTARDTELHRILSGMGVAFETVSDFILVEGADLPARKVFSAFFRLWKGFLECHPERLVPSETPSFRAIKTAEGMSAVMSIPHQKHPFFDAEFGKKRLAEHIRTDYAETRDRLDLDGTSRLSPYLRFGVFSVRQIYAASRSNEAFESELAWREFAHHVAWYFPDTKTVEFQESRRGIAWEGDGEKFRAWCRGETGYPIVDACMRQLLRTNWMHNRGRMIVASFLTKDLHVDWRLWEAFFKRHLLDYDENVNVLNWQWSASVGADPKPVRIFNPSLQSARYDPDGHFIRTYLPELSNAKTDDLHAITNLPYMERIVNHADEQRRTLEIYRENRLAKKSQTI